MSNWPDSPQWTAKENLNQGKQYEPADGLTADDINNIVKNLLYLYDNGSEGGSGFVYTVNTSAEVTIPADDLAKIIADPNAIIVEIDSTRPSVETRFYKKGIDFMDGTVFVSIYTVSATQTAEGCLIAYRGLNPTTGVLTARHETNATSLAEVRQEIEGKYLPKPSGNPTEDSLVKVSSAGTSSWQPVSDFLARPTSAANSDRVCIVPDGQIKFGYKNAYKTVYNVENVFVIRDTRGTVPQPDPQREQDGVNLRYLQANYNANPTLDGTETKLTGVTINGTKYKVPSGGGSGDVTAGGNNTFTGSNIFKKAITLYTDASMDTGVSATLDSYKLELHHDFASTQANLNIADETKPYLELKTAGHGKVKYTQESIIYTDTIGNQKTTTLKLPGQGATADSTQTIATLDDCFTYIDKTINNVIPTSTTTTFTADEMTQIYNNYSKTVIHLSTLEGGTTKPVEKFLYPYGKAQETNFFMFVSPVYNNYEYVLTVSGNAGAASTATIARVSVGAKPSGNPTKDSVVKVSSTGTVSYLGIDTTATSASANLVTSGAVAAVEYSLSQSIAGCASEPDISTFPENDDAFFIGEKTSHASKWLPKKQMTLKSHKMHFDAFDSGSSVGQYDDAFISVLCYTETPFTVETLTTFMLATGQSYPVCSPSYGMVGYVRVSNAAGDITWEDKEGNNIALAGINESSYVVTDIQSFFPFE